MPRSANRLNTLVSCFVAGLVLVVVPSPASAQAPGVRGGVSVDPDQFYVGAHFETGPIVDRLHFKPNVEAGFGDNLTLVALNFEFVYKFPTSNQWRLYVGGGPAINIYSFDDDFSGHDDSDAEPGFNILFGAETTRGLFFELKLGTLDSPDLKFGIGYTFR